MVLKSKYLLSLIIVIALFGCNLSDYLENLGDDYTYRDEGGDTKDILNKKPNCGIVPATVIEFKYNNSFIVAKQKPRLPQEPLYEKKYNYPYGNDKFYYWLVLKKERVALGPFNLEEFNVVRLKHNVPDNLILK